MTENFLNEINNFLLLAKLPRMQKEAIINIYEDLKKNNNIINSFVNEGYICGGYRNFSIEYEKNYDEIDFFLQKDPIFQGLLIKVFTNENNQIKLDENGNIYYDIVSVIPKELAFLNQLNRITNKKGKDDDLEKLNESKKKNKVNYICYYVPIFGYSLFNAKELSRMLDYKIPILLYLEDAKVDVGKITKKHIICDFKSFDEYCHKRVLDSNDKDTKNAILRYKSLNNTYYMYSNSKDEFFDFKKEFEKTNKYEIFDYNIKI